MVISFIIIYILSIGSGMVIFSELFISSLVPIRPKLEIKRHKLTKAEQSPAGVENRDPAFFQQRG